MIYRLYCSKSVCCDCDIFVLFTDYYRKRLDLSEHVLLSFHLITFKSVFTTSIHFISQACLTLTMALPSTTPASAMTVGVKNLTSSPSAVSEGDDVWGMPKYQQNFLANLTDEEFLAQVKV